MPSAYDMLEELHRQTINRALGIAEELVQLRVENAKLGAKLEIIKAVIEGRYDEAQELLSLLKEVEEDEVEEEADA